MSTASRSFGSFFFEGLAKPDSMSRGEAQEKIRALGGNVSSSVSRKTDFVIVGPGAGSKLEEAQALEVAVISEEQFLAMLGGKAAARSDSQGSLF